MIVEQSKSIIAEVNKALVGKQDVVEKALMAIYAGGHILLEDVPGTGKTTLALALSKALDLGYKRVQFTPDTMPSDITGFTMFNRETNEFSFTWAPLTATCSWPTRSTEPAPKRSRRCWRLWKSSP